SRRLRLRTEELLSARQLDTAAQELAQLRAALAPLDREIEAARKNLLAITGTVTLTSAPAGVAWEITDAFGRTQRGTTPAEAAGVASGPAEIVFRHAGWQEHK